MGADDAGAGAHLAVLERGVGPDHGVLGDDRRAEQLHARQDRDVGVELDVGVDPGGAGVHHGDAVAHPPGHDAPVELLAHLGQLDAVVGALGLHHVVDGERADGEAVLARDLDGVGQVVLALGVVVGQPRQRADQELRVEGEDPRADLGDLALLRRGVLLLDDPLDVTLVVAEDPPVAERVGHDPAQDAHHLLGGPVVGHEPAQALALEQRGVARRDDDRAARRTAGLHAPPAPPRRSRRAPPGPPARRPAPAPCTCAPTCSRWWPTTATTRCGSTDRTAVSTCPIMLRPPMWWSTFIVLLFMRVPPPAARTTTVSSSASLMLPG